MHYEIQSGQCPPLAGAGWSILINYRLGWIKFAESMSTPACDYSYIEVLPPPAGDKVHSTLDHQCYEEPWKKLLILEQQLLSRYKVKSFL
jgi:hypothetical protein